MTLNIPNLDRLISHLEGLPEEKFGIYGTHQYHKCGSATCFDGHCMFLFGSISGTALSLPGDKRYDLFITPPGWSNDSETNKIYTLQRALRLLRHMRSEYLRTGQVVVDWDAPEPVTKTALSAPRATERKLPAEIISLLRSAQHSEVSA